MFGTKNGRNRSHIHYYIVNEYKIKEPVRQEVRIMTSQINEMYPYDMQINREPSWARAERLAYCEDIRTQKRDSKRMNSLRDMLNKFLH